MDDKDRHAMRTTMEQLRYEAWREHNISRTKQGIRAGIGVKMEVKVILNTDERFELYALIDAAKMAFQFESRAYRAATLLADKISSGETTLIEES